MIFVLMMAAHEPQQSLLEARYAQVPGTDAEYAQGAIERNDLAHREVEHFVWLILVDGPPDVEGWQTKLNDAVDPKHGTFTVRRATPDQEEAVRTGKITLQR